MLIDAPVKIAMKRGKVRKGGGATGSDIGAVEMVARMIIDSQSIM